MEGVLAKKLHSESNRFFKNFKILDFENFRKMRLNLRFLVKESQILKKLVFLKK